MLDEIFQAWLAKLPAATGLLKSNQNTAREYLLSNELPKNSMEEWRLTNIKQIKTVLSLPLIPKENSNSARHSLKLPPEHKEATRIIIDQTNESNVELPEEIEVLSDKEIKEKLNAINLKSNSWIKNINEACTNKILALRIKKKLAASIEILMPSEENYLSTNRILIIVDNEAKLNLLQIAIGSSNSAINNITEVYLNESSQMNHGFIGFGKVNANILSQININQANKSNYTLTSVQQGWSMSRLDPKVIQTEGRAFTNLRGLQVSSEKQQLATHSSVEFKGPEGFLNQLQKSIATNQSHCIFNGAIHVPRIAQKTNASQLSRNLLISDQARIDTKPELEIIADDVKCAHGATVSQLHEDELFYLRSRGINTMQATSLLLTGYCQEILDKLPLSANRWKILEQIVSNLNK